MKKFLMILCIVSILFSQGAVVFADWQPNDTMDTDEKVEITDYNTRDLEPNDTIDTAEKVEITDYNKITKYGIVSPTDLVDWYKITPSVTGISFFRLMPRAGTVKNYTLSLHYANGDLITEGKNIINAWLDIDYIYIRQGVSCYIKVEYKGDTMPSEPYRLILGLTQP